jgi:hypothetical protein
MNVVAIYVSLALIKGVVSVLFTSCPGRRRDSAFLGLFGLVSILELVKLVSVPMHLRLLAPAAFFLALMTLSFERRSNAVRS